MGRNFTNFEEGLKNSVEGYEVPYNQAHWDELSQKMDGKKASSISTIAASVVTAMLLAGGAFYFASQNPTADNQDSTPSIADASNTSEHSKANKNSKNEITTPTKVSSEDNQKKGAESTTLDLTKEDFSAESTSIKISEENPPTQKTSLTTSTNPTVNTNSPKNTNGAKSANKENENTTFENSKDLTSVDNSVNENSADEMTLLPAMSVSQHVACAGEFIDFKAENIDGNQNFLWNFGNGDFSTDIAPERKFDEPGIYNVTLILSRTSKEVQSKITINPKPEADFSAKISEPGEVVFENHSKDGGKSTWMIEDEHLSNDINPTYYYTQGGSEHITLTVENEFGCSDVARKDVLLTAPYIIRNAPGELSSGTFFKPSLDGITSEVMNLQIMNLNSQLIYENTSTNPSWNGTYPDGTYPESGSEFVWLIKVLDENGNEIASDSGQFTIIP